MGLLRLQLPKCGQLGLYGVRNRDCLELGGFTFLIAICRFCSIQLYTRESNIECLDGL